MTKTHIAKLIARTIVGVGTTMTTASIIRNNTAPQNVAEQAAIASSSVVIGMMAADATQEYTDAKIDEIAAWLQENVKH